MALSTIQRNLSSSRPLSLSLSDIFWRAELESDLAAVERLLTQRMASHSALLTASGMHIISAGGKRLRAAMVLLAARLCHYDLGRAIHPAAAIELLHGASLVHDDLVDHASRRRGRVTVHERWSNNVALMLGDYLFALASDELSAEPDPRIIRFYAEAAQTVAEGELSPVTQVAPLEVALDQYRYKIGCKTAALFEAACKAGIAVAGGSPDEISALGQFGYNLGMAFQIVDDVLDFTGNEATLGKPAGNDLREGTLTLPLIYAVASSTNELLSEIGRTARTNPALVPEVVAAVIDAGGAEMALDEARRLADGSRRLLDRFPNSRARQALYEIGEFILTRQV